MGSYIAAVVMFFLKVFIFSELALQTCFSQTEQSSVVVDSESPGTTATECLSYIYVAWIIFIYSVGLGVETAQFSQVVTNIYTFIPEDCGGYYTGQDPIAPANLLIILLLSSASTNTNN